MYRFQNGDRCPCCGQVLEGKSEDFLELFSQTVHLLGLDPGPVYRIPTPPNPKVMPVSPSLRPPSPEVEEVDRLIQAAFDRLAKEGR